MTRRILILVATLIVTIPGTLSLKAQNYSRTELIELAVETVKKHFPGDQQHLADRIGVISFKTSSLPLQPILLGEKGFVLISKSKTDHPVIGFSWDGYWPNESEMAPEMSAFIEALASQSRNAPINPLYPTASAPDQKNSQSFPPVSALLKTKWNNDSLFCAEFPSASITNASAVIAMGQVFRYYERPLNGDSSYCYIHALDGEICLDFSSRMFEYGSMDNLTGNVHSANLLFCLAIAAHVQPSGASLYSYIDMLPRHYRFSADMRQVNNSEADLRDVILHHLNLKRPVPADWRGSSFVIDGYLGLNYFHFNMGKGGLLDGYYDFSFPHVMTDQNNLMLNCYTDFHPLSTLPAPKNLSIGQTDQGVTINWTITLPDTLVGAVQRVIILRNGLVRIGESTGSQIYLDSTDIGTSCDLMAVADYGSIGSSEMSVPLRYYTSTQPANMPSGALRVAINTILGYGADLYRQPTVGETEMIRELEINFVDQRGIEQLVNLDHLRIMGPTIRTLQGGDWLSRLHTVWFLDCKTFDHTVLKETNNLYQVTGRQGIPFDFYDLRHNADLGSIIMSNHDELDNQLTDFYRFEKYFPKISHIDVYHSREPGLIDSCYISVESWNDFLPRIPHHAQIRVHSSPSVMVPCYPQPARDQNKSGINEISWYCNPNDEPGVFYNVYIGERRNALELKAVFIRDKHYGYNFENNKDYYWRVEAFRNDSTFYSGIFHFSTYTELPFPWADNFDRYYNNDTLINDSPFWITHIPDQPARAYTTNTQKNSGFYSLKLPPASDAALWFEVGYDSSCQVDFYILNQGANLKAEGYQRSALGNPQVNSYLEFTADNELKFISSQETVTYAMLPGEWNHVQIHVNHQQKTASLTLNQVMVKQWNWAKAMTGTDNLNPLAGFRFWNTSQGSNVAAYIDDFMLLNSQSTAIDEIFTDKFQVMFAPELNELIFKDQSMVDIERIILVDLTGKIQLQIKHPVSARVQLPANLPNGIYLIKIEQNDGKPMGRKVAIFR